MKGGIVHGRQRILAMLTDYVNATYQVRFQISWVPLSKLLYNINYSFVFY